MSQDDEDPVENFRRFVDTRLDRRMAAARALEKDQHAYDRVTQARARRERSMRKRLALAEMTADLGRRTAALEVAERARRAIEGFATKQWRLKGAVQADMVEIASIDHALKVARQVLATVPVAPPDDLEPPADPPEGPPPGDPPEGPPPADPPGGPPRGGTPGEPPADDSAGAVPEPPAPEETTGPADDDTSEPEPPQPPSTTDEASAPVTTIADVGRHDRPAGALPRPSDADRPPPAPEEPESTIATPVAPPDAPEPPPPPPPRPGGL